MADGTIPVVAAVVRRDGRYLLGRRPREKRHGDLWEFPGGKLQAGEDHVDGARRELREEMHLEVVGGGAELFTARDPGSPFVIAFVEIITRGEPAPTEHTEVGWFTPAELEEMTLAPSDAAFARTLNPTPPRPSRPAGDGGGPRDQASGPGSSRTPDRSIT